MDSGDIAYPFEHALTRQGAYDEMPPSVRPRLHDLAARQLEDLEAGELDSASPNAAEHLRAAIE